MSSVTGYSNINFPHIPTQIRHNTSVLSYQYNTTIQNDDARLSGRAARSGGRPRMLYCILLRFCVSARSVPYLSHVYVCVLRLSRAVLSRNINSVELGDIYIFLLKKYYIKQQNTLN